MAIAKACQISTPCERPQSLVLQGLRYNRRAPVTHTFPRRASISTRPRRPATCARHKVRFGNRTRDGPNAAARTREARTRDTHNLPNTIHNPPHGRAGIFRIMGVQCFSALLFLGSVDTGGEMVTTVFGFSGVRALFRGFGTESWVSRAFWLFLGLFHPTTHRPEHGLAHSHQI